ncbi:MAG TPA: TonB-dependent receptor [Steroidobacteraceae bacterium]|nr:TonB-dependent receptor [Steroidobacteraceae bacterium]
MTRMLCESNTPRVRLPVAQESSAAGPWGLSKLARRSVLAAAVTALCGVGLSSPAWSQNGAAAADQTAQAADQGSNELQEVVVTAERRAEDVQSTPIAVTAVTGDQLRAQNVTKINDLTQVAPALSVTNQGGYQLVTMRGVGNSLGEDPITTGVPVILDGMANPRGTGLGFAYFDLADVELLRGPQGTYIGSNSTGGAITINSANPNFRGVNGYAELQAGNYHDNLVEAAVNLPVSDTFAMRVAVHTEVENSFYSLQGTDRQETPWASQAMLDPGNTDERSVRASFLWKPTNSFQLLFKVQYDENNTDGLPYNVNPNSYAPLPGEPCPAAGTAPKCYNQYYPYYSGQPFVLNYAFPYSKYEYWDRFYLGEMRYTFGNGTTFRLFAGTEANQTPEIDPAGYSSQNDGFANGGTGIGAEPDTNANVEINLISPQQGRFSWIVGAAYVDSNGAFTDYSATTGPPTTPGGTPSPAVPTIVIVPAGEETRQAGVFGDLKFNITDTLQFEGGLRGNWDNNYGQGTFNIFPAGTYSCNGVPATNATPCTIPIPTGNLIPNVAGAPFPLYNPKVPVFLNNVGYYHSEHQTFKFGLYWQATPDNYLYAFYAKGYKPGVTQFHAFSTTQPNAQAEVLYDYEVGWKGTYLNHRLTTQLDGYYDDYSNMQQNIFNVNAVQNGGLANVPHATIYGAEFNAQMQLIGGFGANVSAAYTHSDLGTLTSVATYKEPAGFGQGAFGALPQCAAGVPNSNTCFNYGPYVVNLGGERAPLAPTYTANVTLQYGIRIGDAILQPRIQYSYESSQFFNLLQADDYYEENAHSLWNAYLDFIDGAWRTSLYTTNFTNQVYMTSQNGNAVLYGAPLQFGVQTTRTF